MLFVQVQFEVCDATKCKYAAETFDIIYSRDTILHISDKRDLFTKFLVSMSTMCLCVECDDQLDVQ